MIDTIHTTEYQIFIGCKDGHTQKEIVTEEELRKLISAFFEKRNPVPPSDTTTLGSAIRDKSAV